MRFFQILEALFYDHSFLTIFRLNFHKVDSDLYRSAQPNPYQLKKIIAEKNIKTVFNLRGDEDIAILNLEREVCKKQGITLVEEKFFSRRILSYETLIKAKKILESIEYPVLIHCKAGADRTGMISVLYLHFIKNLPLHVAKQKELKLFPYGHFNFGKTGILDWFFDQFLKHQKTNPNANLLEWSKSIDAEELKKQYKPNSLWDFFLDKVLRRE